MTAHGAFINLILASLLFFVVASASGEVATDSTDTGKSTTPTLKSKNPQPSSLDTTTNPKASRIPAFSPTNLGSPKTRLGGATRVSGDDIPRAEALVPEQAGQTLRAHPVLYWRLLEQTNHRIEFTLTGIDPVEQLVATVLEGGPGGGFSAGIQAIRLEDQGITLAEGSSYQWYVAIVPDPEKRQNDRVIGGGIERLVTPAQLQSKLDAAPVSELYFILAEAGIWYDALDSLSQQITSSPENATLREHRAELLQQVGIGRPN